MNKSIFSLLALLCTTFSYAQRTSDIENSNYYPFVSRFEYSMIEYYKYSEWGKYPLPASFNDDLWHWEDSMILEGTAKKRRVEIVEQ